MYGENKNNYMTLMLVAVIAAFGVVIATAAVLPIVQQAFAPRPADTEPEDCHTLVSKKQISACERNLDHPPDR